MGVCMIASLPSRSTSQAQPLPNWVTPAFLKSAANFSFAVRKKKASFMPSSARRAVDWNSMLTSASGRCSGFQVPSARGMPWSHSIMSCWTMASHFGSG